MTKAEISSEGVPKQEPSPSVPVPDPTTGPSVAPDDLGAPLVVLSEVDKHFGQLYVLQKINLTVRISDLVSGIGP
jgi:glutamate transport system ATP-binding protein